MLGMSDLTAHHPHPENWHRAGFGSTLRDFVLGVSDGLVAVLSFVAGTSASIGQSRLILLAGIAEMAAGATSMGLGAFLATKAERDHYEREVAREKREILEVPALERQEVREIYKKKGFSEAELDMIVQRL